MICHDCQGTGQSEALHETLTCSRCGGAGMVSDEMPNWIERGRGLRQAREDAGLSMGEMANRMGNRADDISAIEIGRVRNLDVNYSEYLEA